MIFRRKEPTGKPSDIFDQRIKRLIGETRDRPATHRLSDADEADDGLDVMALLVELRASAKRGNEPAAARRLGPEFSLYLGEFYNLPAELQPPAIDALLESRRKERAGDLEGAAQICESALTVCPRYLPLLERLAALETARGETVQAERWYTLLLAELDRAELYPRAVEICRRLVESGATDPELLERASYRLEANGEPELAARCWERRAENLMVQDRPAEALIELDHALNLLPEDARLHLALALVYERLEDVDRAAAEFELAEKLAFDDSDTLGRVLLIRARVARPDEMALGRLMDLLEARPDSRRETLLHCDEAVLQSPYNPHLRYLQGVLLAQGGQLDEASAALRISIDRYSVQADRTSELEARQVLQQLLPLDEENRRRVAELHFERGEVRQAMQALAGLARVARGTTPG